KEIIAFFRDRLYQTFLERGHRYDIINAVLGAGFDNVSDFSDRVDVISKISETTAWQELVTLVERTFNIGKGAPSTGEVDENLLQQEEERSLWEIYVRNKDRITSLIDDKKYEEASRAFSDTFARPVHTFFDKVFVNVEDKRLRNNRLVLIKNINQLYAPRVADLSQIVPPVEGAK
ncbi:MAG: DALR anticodon-binding domain-containing protein, partial [Candidatus Brocadiales bacterium]